jgi:hypothetical protein
MGMTDQGQQLMNFFGRKNQKEAREVTFGQKLVEQQVAPGTQLHYDGGLIGRLRNHHNTLLDLSTRAGETARASKFDETKKCVHKFRLLLNEHLLEKNLRLYTYLSCCLKADPDGLELTRDVRRETSGISRKATLFITHYTDAGITEENRAAFLDELAQIKGVLSDSFAREERSLYTLYQPPQAYADGAVKSLPTNADQRSPSPLAGPDSMPPAEPANMGAAVAIAPQEFASAFRAVA